MAETGNSQSPRIRNWVRVALVVSLALNLLILGMVGGAVLGDRGVGPRAALPSDGLGPYGRALGDADRAALRAALRENGPRLRATRDEVRQGFRDVVAALTADPYDHDRLAELLAAQEARVQGEMAFLRGLMLDRVAAMTPADRTAFAERLERILRRGPPGHRDRRREDP